MRRRRCLGGGGSRRGSRRSAVSEYGAAAAGPATNLAFVAAKPWRMQHCCSASPAGAVVLPLCAASGGCPWHKRAAWYRTALLRSV